MDLKSAENLARQIGAAMAADVYLYNGPIDETHFGSLVVAVTSSKRHSKALLVLVTNGGHANSAYRISRFFQDIYDEFIVYVPSYCKSAGTLVVVGAHKLIMSQFAELGPLDVQLMKSDEIGEIRSGLIGRSALASLNEQAFGMFEQSLLQIKRRSRGTVRFKSAAELAAELTVGLFAPIYEQINPINVGEDHRDLEVAIEYGTRLGRYSANVNEDAVRRLVHDYPSHDFVIDLTEARTLFRTVELPSAELYGLTGVLAELALQPKRKDGIVKLLSTPELKTTETEGAKGDQGGKDEAEPKPAAV